MKKIKARRELRRKMGREYTRSDGREANKHGRRREVSSGNRKSRGPQRSQKAAVLAPPPPPSDCREDLRGLEAPAANDSDATNEARRQMFSEQIEDDVKEVRFMERQLRFHKRKNKTKMPQSLIDMGLDDLIEACDVIEKSGKRKADGASDAPPSPATKKRRAATRHEDDDDLSERSGSASDSAEDDELVDAESDSDAEDDASSAREEEEEELLDDDDAVDECAEEDEPEIAALESQLRLPLQQLTVESLERLVGIVRRLLVEAPRALMVRALTRQILACCSARAGATPLLVLNLAALLTALHVQGVNMGASLTAPLLEALVLRYHKMWTAASDELEATNLLLLVGHLFQFGVCEHRLLVELMQLSAARLHPYDITLIIEVLKAVGFALRKASPADMKAFLSTIQRSAQTTELSSAEDRTRVQFLTDTVLTAIVNNNYRKLPGYEPFHAEAVKQLLPSLRAAASSSKSGVAGRQRAAPALACALQDLLTARKRGRWWLIGSSYLDKDGAASGGDAAANGDDSVGALDEALASPQVSALAQTLGVAGSAHRLRMLTAMLSVASPVAAFEALQRLSLSRVHEQDLMPLLLLCLLRGRAYNAFYADLLSRYCQYHRRFKMSLRCALWDQFARLEMSADDAAAQQQRRWLRHLGRALAGWLLEGTVAWTVLRRFPLEAAALGAHANSVASGAARRLFVELLCWLCHEGSDGFPELESSCDVALRRRLRKALRACAPAALSAAQRKRAALGAAVGSDDVSPRQALRRIAHALRTREEETDSAQLLSRALQ